MQVKDVMTTDPACCISETALQEVAQMMIDHDCGEIPVVENKETKRPIGVITDRDIVCRMDPPSRQVGVEQDHSPSIRV